MKLTCSCGTETDLAGIASGIVFPATELTCAGCGVMFTAYRAGDVLHLSAPVKPGVRPTIKQLALEYLLRSFTERDMERAGFIRLPRRRT